MDLDLTRVVGDPEAFVIGHPQDFKEIPENGSIPLVPGKKDGDPEQLKIEIERQVWRVAKGDVEKIVRWCVSNQADAWSKLLGQLSRLDVQPLQSLPSKEVTELLNVHFGS